MNLQLLHWNLLFAWGWILLGFLSGMAMGLCFHREQWLGGYGSWKRRLYRLGHISFFGLGCVNLVFWVTARLLPAAPASMDIASVAFVIGGVTMPLCCALAAHLRPARHLFAIPVVSLLIAGAVTFWSIL
jgi:hypothetical protein